MEQNHPAIPVRQFVNRRVGGVGVRFLYELELAKAAVVERVEFLHLLDDVGRIQIDKAERNDSRGILFRRISDHFTVGVWSEHARRHIQPLTDFH